MSFPPASITPPTLSDWQYKFGAVLLGSQQSWAVQKSQGLDVPPIRSADTKRPRDSGSFAGLDVLDERTITLLLHTQAASSAALATLLQQLGGLVVPGGEVEAPLWLKRPGYPQLGTMVRCRGHQLDSDNRLAYAHVAQPTLVFEATDPRLYAATLTPSCGLGSGTLPGATFPVTFPLSFGGGTTAGTISCNNSGTMEMRPILVITGPVTNPSVANTSIAGNPTLTFTNPNQTGYTVLAGDQLIVDLDTHAISYLVNGTTTPAARPNWLVSSTSTWWNLPPGTSVIQFSSADSGAVGGTLEVQYAPAYAAIV